MPLPGDDGYTLSEMLAALMIIGLAMGGVFEAGELLERHQRASLASLASPANLDSARRGLQMLTARYQAPVSQGADLSGDPQGFSFPCGSRRCSARIDTRSQAGATLLVQSPDPERLALGPVRRAHFIYVGREGGAGNWPSQMGAEDHLRAVELKGEDLHGDEVLALARIWNEEPPGCRFDVISRACRTASP